MAESPAERGKKLFEKEDAEQREIAKKFDPVKLIEDSQRIRTIKDPVLGEVKYTLLTAQDLFEISEVKAVDAQTKIIFFKLFHKAYPGLKCPDDIGKLPAETLTRLSEILWGKDNFFGIPKTFQSGSKQTTPQNASA